MNCWNSPSIEAGARIRASGAGASGGPTSLVAGVISRLTGCSNLLGTIVLGEMFLQECEPRVISAERNLTELF